MLTPVSSALSGLVASSQRLEASANNVANANSLGAIPSDDAGNPAVSDPEAYRPVRVEQSSSSSAGGSTGGTETATRYISPSYRPEYNPQASFADENGFVAKPNVDLGTELLEQMTAEQSFMGNMKTVEAVSAMVRKLYDLG